MRRREVAAAAPGGDDEPQVCGLATRFPTLFAFLSDLRFDDGTAREPGTMTLFTERGWFKACLNDRDAGLVTFVAGSSLEALLSACDEMLQTDTLDWRPGQKSGRRKQSGA